MARLRSESFMWTETIYRRWAIQSHLLRPHCRISVWEEERQDPLVNGTQVAALVTSVTASWQPGREEHWGFGTKEDKSEEQTLGKPRLALSLW